MEKTEETQKRKHYEKPAEGDEASSGDLGNDDDLMAWLSTDDIDNNSAAELLKILDSTGSTSSTASSRVRFIENPYSSTLVFQCSTSYVTINGNEESCGSSFSDTESSMMASVDMRGILRANVDVGQNVEWSSSGPEAAEGGALGASEWEARDWMAEEGGYVGTMNGCDVFGLDSEWKWDEDELARFLGEDSKFIGVNVNSE